MLRAYEKIIHNQALLVMVEIWMEINSVTHWLIDKTVIDIINKL